jgi:hypothetical protein
LQRRARAPCGGSGSGRHQKRRAAGE